MNCSYIDHCYETRLQDYKILGMSLVKTDVGKRSISYSWNALQTDVRDIPSRNSFRKNLKSQLLEDYKSNDYPQDSQK